MVVDIGGVRQGMSELLHTVYAKPLGICCGFAAVLNLNFGFPCFLGERVPLWWWILVASDRTSVSCYRPSMQSHKVSVVVLPRFEVKFWALWGVGLRGVRWGVSDFLLIVLQSQ